jgi:hypothetical protein
VFIKDQGYKQTILAKTEFIRQTLNPEWKPFAISTFDILLEGKKALIYTIHNWGGRKREINTQTDTVTVKCYDWDEDGSHDLIGMFSCQVQELLYSDVVYPLVNPDKKRYAFWVLYNNKSFVMYILRPVLVEILNQNWAYINTTPPPFFFYIKYIFLCRPMYKNSGLLSVRSCKPTTPPFTVLPAAYSIKCSALKLPTSLIGKTGALFFRHFLRAVVSQEMLRAA